MGTRQRKVIKGGEESNDGPNLRRPGKGTGPMRRGSGWQPSRSFLALMATLGFLSLVYIGLCPELDQLALSLSLHRQFHVVVIDAGSTASRVVGLTFHRSMLQRQLILDDELFFETKPGLSAYAKRPTGVREPLELLLAQAKARIPETEWQHTPLVMKATAGLRLLPGHEAQDILSEARLVLESSGFQLAPNAVEIMRGSDEGIFSWFSCNFLIDRLGGPGSVLDYSQNTVAALDLGGGSTQVTFALLPSDVPRYAHLERKNQLKHVNAFGRNLTLFTQSFLGMGLMAARKEIFTHPDNLAAQGGKAPDLGGSAGPIELRAECVNPIISKATWSYSNKDYLISGPVNGSHKIVKTQNFAGVDEDVPVVNFTACLEIIKKVVNASVPSDVPSLVGREIYAFSYYFERATEAGLIDPFEGGVITLDKFYRAAQDACDFPNADQPFSCLDLSFIYVLLHDGFGIEDTAKISLRKKVRGHELNWALGAAFKVLNIES